MTKTATNPAITRRGNWIIIVAIWLFVLSFPLITHIWRGSDFVWDEYIRYLIGVSVFIEVYYINKLYLIKRFLFERRVTAYLLANLIVILALLYIAYRFNELLPELTFTVSGSPGMPPMKVSALRYIVPGVLMCILVSAISVAGTMSGAWYAAEAERKELERSRSEAELQNLKSQLNPHFLFNTLNNIYSMIAINQDRAQEAVHELSRLLRYVLYESGDQLVAMEKDFDFLRNYVELMRIRLPGNVKLTSSIETASPQALIAPLLLISLVENAFKHGASNNCHSFVNIQISADDRQLSCMIENSYFPKAEQDDSGSGIGLTNLRRRLGLIYEGRHTLVEKLDGDVYRTTLYIQI